MTQHCLPGKQNQNSVPFPSEFTLISSPSDSIAILQNDCPALSKYLLQYQTQLSTNELNFE